MQGFFVSQFFFSRMATLWEIKDKQRKMTHKRRHLVSYVTLNPHAPGSLRQLTFLFFFLFFVRKSQSEVPIPFHHLRRTICLCRLWCHSDVHTGGMTSLSRAADKKKKNEVQRNSETANPETGWDILPSGTKNSFDVIVVQIFLGNREMARDFIPYPRVLF